MTYLINTNNGDGQVDGDTLDSGNSAGGGDTYSFVGGADPEFDDAKVFTAGGFSNLSAKCVGADGANYFRWDSFSTYAFRGSLYLNFGTLPSSNSQIFLQCKTSGGTDICHMGVNTSGQMYTARKSYGTITGSTYSISANTWYRVDFIVNVDVSDANAGRIRYRVTDVDSGDTDTYDFEHDSGAAETLDSVAIGRVYMGNALSNSHVDVHFQTVRAEDTDSAFFTGLYLPAELVEELTDNLALIKASAGTGPYSIAQDSGTTTTPLEVDDGATSDVGLWLIEKHTVDTLVYTVTDDSAVESAPFNVPPIGVASSIELRPSGSIPGTTWV